MYFSKAKQIRLYLFSILFLIFAGFYNSVYATVDNISCELRSDTNKNRIGTLITINLTFRSTSPRTASLTATISLPGVSNPMTTTLPLVQTSAGSRYWYSGTAQVTVTAGNLNGTSSSDGQSVTPIGTITETVNATTINTEPIPTTPTSIVVDNQNPAKNGALLCEVKNGTNFVAYAGQRLKKGDVIRFTQRVSTQDVATGLVTLTGAIGANLNLRRDGDNPTSLVSDSIELSNGEGQVTCFVSNITDNAGNTTTYGAGNDSITINIDCNGPRFVNATVTNADGDTAALAGSTLVFSCTIANYDSDTVYVGSTQLSTNHGHAFSGCFPLYLQLTGTPLGGNQATFRGTLVLPNDADCQYVAGQLLFYFIATDASGNQTTKTNVTFTNQVDLLKFTHSSSKVKIYSANMEEQQVATSTSILVFETIASTSAPESTIVTVDLTPIGASFLTLNYDTLGSKTFKGTYSGGFEGVQLDNQFVQFQVTAIDQYSQSITRTTTPPILIDNVGPRINSYQITGATGIDGSIINNDKITIRADISGANAQTNPVIIDLTSLDDTGVHKLTNTSTTNWQLKHTVASGTIDDDYDFILIATDNHGNITQNVLTLKVDNEPPVLDSQNYTITYQQNPPYIIIGDYIKTEVTLKKGNDGISVKIDLSELTGEQSYGIETMTSLGNTFRYNFDIATGPINNGAIFPLIIKDNAGNVAIASSTGEPINASFTFLTLDQNPPDPLQPQITLENHTDTVDVYPGSVNTKKTITFVLPFTKETTNEDSATATLDVTHLCKLTDGSMEYVDANLLPSIGTTNFISLPKVGNSYRQTIVATESIGLKEKDNYEFEFVMYDQSGNKRAVKSTAFQKVDLNPPVITSIIVNTTGGIPLKIGDIISFKVYASGTDGRPPTIDLSSLNLDNNIQMRTDPNTTGVYYYDVTIEKGEFDNEIASWPITCFDGCDNSVTSYTRAITIDNKPPEISTFYVTADSIALNQRINYTENSVPTASLTFTITASEPLIVTLDLTAIGGSAAQPAVETQSGPNVYEYTYQTTTARTSVEFENYRFEATIKDVNSNQATFYSQSIKNVDCEVPIINSMLCGYELSSRSEELPAPKNVNILRIGDKITFYASMTAALDAIASISISIDPSVATLSKEMTYNSTTNRHEAEIIIKAPSMIENGATWGSLNSENLYYIITAADDVANIATPTSGLTTYVVKNTYPTVASYSLTISPDYQTLGIFNVASGTSRNTRDNLIASATLANNAQISTVTIDLSSIGGVNNHSLASITGSVVSNEGNGIDVAAFSTIDFLNAQIPITIYDEAGYSCEATHNLLIDTKIPEITSISFDGEKIQIYFSENIFNLDESQWKLVGSATVPIGTTAKLDLKSTSSYVDAWNYSFDNLEIDLSLAGRKEVTNWASQPLYFEVSRLPNKAAATDQYNNWIASYSFFPVTITDYSWREDPAISNFAMTHKWPNQTYFDIQFTQEMDKSTFVASDAVIYVDVPPTVGAEFDDVSYDGWYVFQKNDSYEWIDNKHLKITLSASGTAWIAYNLTNNPNKILKFVQRSASRRMVKGIFDKLLQLYTIENPYEISDNRSANPLSALNVLSDPKPIINLASATIELHFSDRAKLFNDRFVTKNEIDPLMGDPVPHNSNGSDLHRQNITLFNIETDQGITLNCASITVDLNPVYASSTVRIKLTETDINNILNFYNTTSTINWGLQINANSFTNLWNIGNTAYKPTSPGTVEVIEATITEDASIIDVAVSDMPPTKDDPGNFNFEFEITKTKAGNIYLPFSTVEAPKAAIFEISTGNRIASGTFIGWTTRIVRNVERTVAIFKTSEPFQKDVDGVPAELRLYELKDIFGNSCPILVASYVYDINQKNGAVATGFNTASEAFIIDNVEPTAISISPTLVGITNTGADIFYIDYSETMDTNFIPSLSIATGSTVIGLSFNRWENSDKRAVFTINQPITEDTLNGTWTYKLSGGQDLAGNAFISSEIDMTIKSGIPKIVNNSMKLYSIRDKMDINTVVTNKPLNFDSSPTYTEIGFEYVSAATENLPHNLCFYDSSNNQIGTATVVQNGVYATATFNMSSFDTTPSTNSIITVKIRDIAGNISTNPIWSFDYYKIAPNVSTMSLLGVATISQGIYYYRTALPNMQFNATLSNSYTNPLNLLIASYPLTNIATMTYSTQTLTGLTFTDTFGSTLAENTYLITLADEAGNLTTGASPLTLIVDDTPPTILNIIPDSTGRVSSAKIGMATFTVIFAEPMDTTVTPTLTLATSTMGATINMNFVGWGNDMMTASFTNSVAIVATYPAGYYNYSVTGAQDLAGNLITTTPTNLTTYVQAQGPGVSTFTILTLQPDISDTVLENRAFNPVKYNAGNAASVTFKIDYVSGPFDTPHKLLIYDESGNNIATLPVNVGNPGFATWYGSQIPTTPATYSFRMQDNLGNFGPEDGYLPWKFRVDTSMPTFTSINFNDGGIGQTVSGIRYYSPSVPATFSVTTTTETEDLVLIASSTATSSYIIPATSGYSISFGSSLTDGDILLFVSDLAGNINDTSSIKLLVDSIPPQVIFAQCVDVDNGDSPLATVGKTATVLVTFDKVMNRNITPIVQLATDTTSGLTEVATLTLQSWRDDYNAVFTTNGVFDTINFPVGTSSIVVSDARDLAGNLVTTGTYGEVEVISRAPSFFADLVSQQKMLSDYDLNNNPFSLRAEPNIATITIGYNPLTNDPHALDHTLLLYDGAGNNIATHTLTGGAKEITVDTAFFGDYSATIAPPAEVSGTFTIKLMDRVGNISSPQTPFELNYDSISPKVTNFNITGVSTGSTLLTYYYNPDIIGSLTSDITLNASDAIKLVIYGTASSPYGPIATRTYQMPLTNALTYTYEGKLDYLTEALPEGTYKVAAVDMAGNFAVLSAAPAIKATANLLVDKTAPSITVATITDALYISSGEIGMATFSIQFNESMFGDAYQYLEIATTSYKIPCRFIRLDTTTTTNDTAIFETAVSVGTQIPQGSYVYHVVGTDLTGNRIETDFGEIFVKSGGPLVSSIKTYSYQQTTASDTLDSGNEYHYDDVFSFNVEPKAATMTISLLEEPDGDPSMIWVTFLKKITINQQSTEVIVASYPVTLDSNLMATFTWDTSTPPTVATTATYIIRVADVNNDLSYYNYEWSADSEAPTYSGISFNSGINFPASGVVYLNPYRHTNFEVTFKNLRDMGPRLRVTSEVSTDTYPLTSLSNYQWKTAFRGKYSRDTGNPDDLMPDGIYNIGLVDQAGNLAASGTEEVLYQMVLDTKNPDIGTITLKVEGVNIGSYCSPSETRPLVVSLETDEPLTATGAYYIDIYNSGNVLINRLNIVDNGGTLQASWDGKNSAGTVVSDGTYTFRVSDICGNSSTTATSTTAVTSPFGVMSPAVQTAYNSVKIWFNHAIDANTVGATTITSTPLLSISNIHLEDERALAFNATGMTHGASYTLIVSGALRNIYGSNLSTTASSAIFFADVKGPAIVGTTFAGVNNQNEIMVQFDQTLDRTSAENPSSYNIISSSGNSLPISAAILQPDNLTVLLVVSDNFIENANYIVKAPGVKDELGNSATESSLTGFSFRGRDVTPPTFVISAFSNAANENDIIVIAVSNEELIRVPTLTITHGYASPVTVTMQMNASNKLAFMAAASLKASNGLTGSLKVDGEDLNGNKGSSTGSFVIASVKTNSSLRLSSNDKQFSLIFDKNSLKSEATVKILQRPIIKDETATGTIQTQLQEEYASMRGIRASVSSNEEATNSELVPITDAYEASVLSSKINKGITASLKIPESASQTVGLGLFYQKNGTWKFISANKTSDNEIKAKLASSQILAIMQDTVSPSIKLDESLDLSKAFETARPEFLGNIKDLGSGLDTNSLEAKIDNNTQNITVDNDGNFKFKSLSELINGNHELTISAKDRTGNSASTGSLRFALVLPFEFKQIIQYPNPARNNVTIRIRTNSTDINCHIRIKIYDVAGHKVADFDENDVIDRGDGNFEVRWDLRNKKGKKVANGAYIAKLEAINPETGKKIKSTLKIAVLK